MALGMHHMLQLAMLGGGPLSLVEARVSVLVQVLLIHQSHQGQL